MGELLCHLIGDYVLQNHKMAIRKWTSWWFAILHVTFYLPCFLFLTVNPLTLLVIGGTHLLIDRFRLAGYWTRFWGVGVSPGVAWPWVEKYLLSRLHVSAWYDLTGNTDANGNAVPELESPPVYMVAWLGIIVDNTLHLLINHLAITYIG